MLKANRQYDGEVANGSAIITSNSGTLGYRVALTCEDGPVYFTIWLTPKTKERARETFKDVLGIPEEKLGNQEYYVEMELALDIEGLPVSFTTKEEEYNGKTRTVVQFLNARSKKPTVGSPASFAAFFGGISDADIPF